MKPSTYKYLIRHDNDKTIEFDSPLFVENGMDITLFETGIHIRILKINHDTRTVHGFTLSSEPETEEM